MKYVFWRLESIVCFYAGPAIVRFISYNMGGEYDELIASYHEIGTQCVWLWPIDYMRGIQMKHGPFHQMVFIKFSL